MNRVGESGVSMSKVPPELGEWVCDAPINPARERHFQCESPTGSPPALRFDEGNLVSHAGLVPLLRLAEQTRLPRIIAGKVSITTLRIRSGAANPVSSCWV